MGAAQADWSQGNPSLPPHPLIWLHRGGDGLQKSLAIPRQLCVYITLPSVTVGGFIFSKGLRSKGAGTPLLGALKTSVDEPQQRNPLQGSAPFLGLQGLYLGHGCPPQRNHTSSHQGELRRASPGVPLDSSRHFTGKPRGEGDEEWESCPQLNPWLLGPRSWRKGRPRPAPGPGTRGDEVSP